MDPRPPLSVQEIEHAALRGHCSQLAAYLERLLVEETDGNIDALALLVACSVDVHWRRGKKKSTPLHLLAQRAFIWRDIPLATNLLVAAGADVEARDDSGRTPMQTAAACGWKAPPEALEMKSTLLEWQSLTKEQQQQQQIALLTSLYSRFASTVTRFRLHNEHKVRRSLL